MDAIQKSLLEQVAGLHEVPEGAYNIRANGQKSRSWWEMMRMEPLIFLCSCSKT